MNTASQGQAIALFPMQFGLLFMLTAHLSLGVS